MGWLLLVAACTEMPSSGHLFEPVAETPVVPAAAAPAGADPRFAAPAEPPFRISSEEMAAKAGDGAAAASVDPASLAPSDAAIAAAAAAPAAAVAAPALGARSASSQFPVRLVSTLPQAQPPRAVLGLADGSEVVVTPGSVLGPEGLVVMAVLDGKVQLAKVLPAGDHAAIESIELSAQYR